MSIIDRYLKKTKNEYAYLLKENKFPIREYITTGNYALNTIISGDPMLGLPTGRITQFSGEASVGKSYIAIDLVKEAQKIGYSIFYYDTEGAQNYEALLDRGVDSESFVHIPTDTIKKTQTDILNLLDEASNEKDKIMIVVDSVGNLLSEKEYDDTRSGNDKRDMTKQQEMKSYFRSMAVPAAAKNIPVIVVNHEYKTLEMFAKTVQSGGTGISYNSSIIISMTKSKEIEGSSKTVIGSGVRCTSVKNRFGKEKSQVRVVIDYAKGITTYSGLFDIACDVGFITSPKQGWYQIEGIDKLLRKKEIAADNTIWDKMFENGLREKIKEVYSYKSNVNSKEIIDDFIEDDQEDNSEIEE